MIRVAIASASDVSAAGLRSMLSSFAGLQVRGRAADPASLARLLATEQIDVLVVDSDPRDEDSAALAGAALDAPSNPSMVVLSDRPIDIDLASDSNQGRAFLPRRAQAEELEAAVRGAAAGLIVTHPRFAAQETPVSATAPSVDHSGLTRREIEVLRMLAAGLPNKSIATRLNVSAHTVKFHVGSIMAKLHAASRTEAVTEGIRRGLIFV
jgi:two-component system, NarL family, response regulator YdfI